MTLSHDLLHSRTIWLGMLAIAFVLLVGVPSARSAEPDPAATSLYDLEARRLGGEVERLDRYRGQVLLVVNTASRCGYTPQYEGLQALYSEQRDRGLTVLGFPSNDFGEQEPGSDREIGAFCKASYGVEFPMFSKVVTGGPDAHPVYAYLTSRPAPVGGPVRWNFQKYLVDRQGRVVARFDSNVKPDDAKLRAEIERLLGEPAPAG
ncbi:MAG: glutathione peroxidase [Actinomycetota bacterium]|nr:glutathione peroxidase [Actinomycetota bacterium]